jgi:hypothetical protein
MRRIIYISQSLVAMDPSALDAIVQASVTRNAAAGISGMLWSGASEFVQALEGDHDKVGETMRRIAADARHTGIEIICDCTVQSRMFGAWAMVRSNKGAECTASTAYLIGYAGGQRSPAAHRIVKLLLSNDE